jgi:hypothetical protein
LARRFNKTSLTFIESLFPGCELYTVAIRLVAVCGFPQSILADAVPRHVQKEPARRHNVPSFSE